MFLQMIAPPLAQSQLVTRGILLKVVHLNLGLFPGISIAQIVSSKPLVTENGWNSTVFAVPAQGVLSPGMALGSITGDAVCFDNSPLRP